MRIATSAWTSSGSELTMGGGLRGRYARIRAIVWGCSLAITLRICEASVRRRNSKGLTWMALDRRADDLVGLALAEGVLEELACVVEAALGDVLLRDGDLVELLDDRLLAVGRDVADARDLEGEVVDLLLAEVLEDLGRGVLAEAHQQDRGLLAAAHT